MIVIAIIGILASVAIPAYKDYVHSSEAGAAMKKVSAYASSGQVCVQTGWGCGDLNDAADGSVFTITPTAKKGLNFTISYDTGSCTVLAEVHANGGLEYSAASSSVDVDPSVCIDGAGLH